MNIKRLGRRKLIILTALLVLLLSAGTATVISYLSKKTPSKENHLVPGYVACVVESTSDGNTQTNVSVKNTGNTSAYIRAAVVVTWQSDSSDSEILANAPVSDVDYEVVFADSMWLEGDDGYWYYPAPIEPDGFTDTLIERIAPIGEAPEGYRLSVEIPASAIQSQPVSVVTNEWGVTVSDSGMITP